MKNGDLTNLYFFGSLLSTVVLELPLHVNLLKVVQEMVVCVLEKWSAIVWLVMELVCCSLSVLWFHRMLLKSMCAKSVVLSVMQDGVSSVRAARRWSLCKSLMPPSCCSRNSCPWTFVLDLCSTMLSKPWPPLLQMYNVFLLLLNLTCMRSSFFLLTHSTNVLYDFAMADNKMKKKIREKRNIGLMLYVMLAWFLSLRSPSYSTEKPTYRDQTGPWQSTAENSSSERQERVHLCWWGHEDRLPPFHVIIPQSALPQAVVNAQLEKVHTAVQSIDTFLPFDTHWHGHATVSNPSDIKVDCLQPSSHGPGFTRLSHAQTPLSNHRYRSLFACGLCEGPLLKKKKIKKSYYIVLGDWTINIKRNIKKK